MQVKDRQLVMERMKQHVANPDTTPLLIFPEGTCVNNEYTVMFKRGAFDLGATVCPVAIKYNKIFVDAFWNSKRQSFTSHIVSVVLSSCALLLAYESATWQVVCSWQSLSYHACKQDWRASCMSEAQCCQSLTGRVLSAS